MRYFVGWDVGGWHCDRNRASRDALVVLQAADDEAPVLVGRAWRGSLRSLLTTYRGDALIVEMAGLCGVQLRTGDEIGFAIDAPLGWPAAMLTLAGAGASRR